MIFSSYSSSITKWAFRLYIAWSVIADIIVVGGIVYLLFS